MSEQTARDLLHTHNDSPPDGVCRHSRERVGRHMLSWGGAGLRFSLLRERKKKKREARHPPGSKPGIDSSPWPLHRLSLAKQSKNGTQPNEGRTARCNRRMHYVVIWSTPVPSGSRAVYAVNLEWTQQRLARNPANGFFEAPLMTSTGGKFQQHPITSTLE